MATPGSRADPGAGDRHDPGSAITGGPRLGAGFFDRPVLDVAPDLLGCLITHDSVTIRLTEVEAYDGERDPGSHAFRGQTPRTAVMFGPPGGLYVYFTYGMHFCANLVCGPPGQASAVLLRAGEVTEGIELATARRTRPGRPAPLARDLARGPARLTQALGLAREHNGVDTTEADSPVIVRRPLESPTRRELGAPGVRTGPRVGVVGPGGDAQRYPWRYWLEAEPTVSTYRPGVRRVRRTPDSTGHTPGRIAEI